ncbi:ATP synthase F1 subunit delta, partial [Clostridioides difficile]
VSSNIKNFLKVLVDKDRISYLEDIELAYKELLNKKNNVIDGVAISAIPMSETDIKELEVKLSNKYNKNVTIENVVDKTILGGVLVRIGNEQIDGTVKTRLDKMKEKLSEVIS